MRLNMACMGMGLDDQLQRKVENRTFVVTIEADLLTE